MPVFSRAVTNVVALDYVSEQFALVKAGISAKRVFRADKPDEVANIPKRDDANQYIILIANTVGLQRNSADEEDLASVCREVQTLLFLGAPLYEYFKENAVYIAVLSGSDGDLHYLDSVVYPLQQMCETERELEPGSVVWDVDSYQVFTDSCREVDRRFWVNLKA